MAQREQHWHFTSDRCPVTKLTKLQVYALASGCRLIAGLRTLSAHTKYKADAAP
jgi:hypothetical protein